MTDDQPFRFAIAGLGIASTQIVPEFAAGRTWR